MKLFIFSDPLGSFINRQIRILASSDHLLLHRAFVSLDTEGIEGIELLSDGKDVHIYDTASLRPTYSDFSYILLYYVFRQD